MIVFQTKSVVSDLTAYSALHITRIDIDIDNRRIVVAVQYGSNASGTFVPNKNIPVKTYVLDGAKADVLLSSALASQLIDTMEKRLLNLSLESGTQV